MKTNQLNKSAADLFHSIEQNLFNYTKNKEPECLHHLRVSIKKIKALLYFCENVLQKKYSATKLKPLFDKAGKIREIQINIHLLGLFADPPAKLIEKLKKKEEILSRQFIKNGSNYLSLIKDLRKNVHLPEILPDIKAIHGYFEKEKKKAKKKLKKKDREDVHQYRTKIKKLMYVYDVLPISLQKEIELDEVEVNRQQKKLGDWHDMYSALNFLSNEPLPSKTTEYVAKFKEKEKKQFYSLLRYLKDHRI